MESIGFRDCVFIWKKKVGFAAKRKHRFAKNLHFKRFFSFAKSLFFAFRSLAKTAKTIIPIKIFVTWIKKTAAATP